MFLINAELMPAEEALSERLILEGSASGKERIMLSRDGIFRKRR